MQSPGAHTVGDGNREKERKIELFKTAVETRRLEIELFWRRALFFWGFITAAFLAFSTFVANHPRLAFASAAFGGVCSLCWSLLNRGSKYWQESWETKVERIETELFGESIFHSQEAIQHKGCWLSARRYSVSKLTMALSDFILILWMGLFAYQSATIFGWEQLKACMKLCAPAFLAVVTIGYACAILIFARSSPVQDLPANTTVGRGSPPNAHT